MENDFAKWRQTYRALRDRIRKRRPGDPLGGTIYSIAAELKVNHKTVRRAVQQLVAEGLINAKRRVGLTVCSQPNVLDAVDRTLLVITHGWKDTEQINGLIRFGAERAATAFQLNTRIIANDALETVRPLFKEKRIIGAVVSMYYPSKELERTIKTLQKRKIPVCVVDQVSDGVDSVVADNNDIGRRIARFLFSHHGIKRALLLRRYGYAQAEFERETGIEEYIIENRISHSRFTWMSDSPDPTDLQKRLYGFLTNGLAIDAVYLRSFDHYHVVQSAAADAGLKPLTVIRLGFESDFRQTGDPGILFQLDEMVYQAATLVVERAADPFRDVQVIRTPSRLFIP
ncbi:MAG: GntR family transcriptional regulator [Planctomycetota bacterium]